MVHSSSPHTSASKGDCCGRRCLKSGCAALWPSPHLHCYQRWNGIAIKWSSVICLWQVCVGYSFVLQVFRIEFQWEVLLHPSRDCSGSKLAPVPWVFLLFKVAALCWVYQPSSSHRGPPMINVIFSWIIDNYLVITLANYFNSSGWVPSQPYGLECTQLEPNAASSWWPSRFSSEHTGTRRGLGAGLSVKIKAKKCWVLELFLSPGARLFPPFNNRPPLFLEKFKRKNCIVH